ncbi:MAG: hypothetical protein P4L45_07365 [Ignavibacteriaceae bacterium]|nr:hypothetical protein [Ignavibacteriaceae bacterium]
MDWKNDKWRLIVFLILVISGMLKMLGSEHSDSGRIKFRESVQYCKNSINDRKNGNKYADKYVSILIKIPIDTGSINILLGPFVNHF